MMKSQEHALTWLPILLVIQMIIFSTSITANAFDVPNRVPFEPRMRPMGRILAADESTLDESWEYFSYNQTLDHFNYRPESYTIFPQRYAINPKYWGGAKANAPVFAYLGSEIPMETELPAAGFIKDNAPRFKALQVYIEHRYYGTSFPFGSAKEAFKNSSTLGYFNSAQALADYAEILIHLKEKFNAKDSPVIVIGASYGGELAAWMRLKYPHVVHGALASSAPILSFAEEKQRDQYALIVDKVFKETSKNCHDTIRKSWTAIDQIASKPDGLSILSTKFKTCMPLTTTENLKDRLVPAYIKSVQYNSYKNPLVTRMCQAIDGTSNSVNGSRDILDRISAALFVLEKEPQCHINSTEDGAPASSTQLIDMSMGWPWQVCTEIIYPIGGVNGTIFDQTLLPLFHTGSFSHLEQHCKEKYGIQAIRSKWVTTYYGGQDIKLFLKRFGSNIIFSNGLRDPHIAGSVLENISQSIVAVNTKHGSHCLDILPEKKDDPKWLKKQRETEIKIIKTWISQYYSDLRAYKQGK